MKVETLEIIGMNPLPGGYVGVRTPIARYTPGQVLPDNLRNTNSLVAGADNDLFFELGVKHAPVWNAEFVRQKRIFEGFNILLPKPHPIQLLDYGVRDIEDHEAFVRFNTSFRHQIGYGSAGFLEQLVILGDEGFLEFRKSDDFIEGTTDAKRINYRFPITPLGSLPPQGDRYNDQYYYYWIVAERDELHQVMNDWSGGFVKKFDALWPETYEKVLKAKGEEEKYKFLEEPLNAALNSVRAFADVSKDNNGQSYQAHLRLLTVTLAEQGLDSTQEYFDLATRMTLQEVTWQQIFADIQEYQTKLGIRI